MMRAKFISEDNILIDPESNEESILLNRFVKLINSNQRELSTSGTYLVGTEQAGKYTSLGLTLISYQAENVCDNVDDEDK